MNLAAQRRYDLKPFGFEDLTIQQRRYLHFNNGIATVLLSAHSLPIAPAVEKTASFLEESQ